MFAIPVVSYMFTGFARCSVGRGISRGTRKLTWTSMKKKKKDGYSIVTGAAKLSRQTPLPLDDCIIGLPYYSNPFAIWTDFFVFKESIAMVNCRDAGKSFCYTYETGFMFCHVINKLSKSITLN